jgi:Fe-S cluster assembly ATP-binding protein
MMNKAIFEVKNIYYQAGKTEILKGVNLKIGKNEMRAIIGVNGTGKTTLAAIIMGLEGYTPTEGRMFFNGIDITNLSITERAKLGITLAWQTPADLEGITVREYLSIKKEGISPEKCLRLVGLSPALYLDRTIDEKLSGGERKRIEFASVFSIKPKLVILDEPDSGIDMTSMDAIKKAIQTFKEMGTAVILITHSEGLAGFADKVSLLCDGKIAKEGDVKEVTEFFKEYCERCSHVGQMDKEILK